MRILLLTLAIAIAALEGAARLLGRTPTRSRVPPGRPLLIYDDDCGLCSLAAIGIQLRMPDLELVGFSDLPRAGVLDALDYDALLASAHYVTADGIEYHGGESVTRVLRGVPGFEAVRYLDWPVVRGLRELGYRLVAWQRDRISRALGAWAAR
jgi:predicted DCC family thiol-disulfide oxidoreductase YuxK